MGKEWNVSTYDGVDGIKDEKLRGVRPWEVFRYQAEEGEGGGED